MIVVHIQNIDHKQALEIIDHLLNLSFIYEPTLSINTVYANQPKTGKLISDKQPQITAKTRVFLFDKIADELESMYPKNTPSLYASPIICMDKKHTKTLKKSVAKV